MASNGAGYPPLLTLTNSIYAKRKDGNFYPGLIEDKHLDTYTVKFNDGTRERIEEGDLTWLGFWGLPPRTWPRAPFIQPAVAPWKVFEGRNTAEEDYSEFQGNECSFSEQGSEETWLRKLEINEASQSNGDTGSHRQTSSELAKHTPSNHSRSSVLRLNRTVLSKETTIDDISIAFARGSSKDNRPSSQPSEKYEKMSDFENVFVRSFPDEATQSGHTNEELQRNIENDRKFERNKEFADYSLKRRRHSMPEGIGNSKEENEMRLTDNDLDYYRKNHFNISPNGSDSDSLSMSPENLITPQFPFFRQPFGMTVFGTSPHDAIPYSFQIQTKARKRGEKKKCRKVYGIENRHFWCTQCRWKKACTRFSSSHRINDHRSEFV